MNFDSLPDLPQASVSCEPLFLFPGARSAHRGLLLCPPFSQQAFAGREVLSVIVTGRSLEGF